MEIKWSDNHKGYLEPKIYRLGSSEEMLGYEIYNKRGGVKIDDTRLLLAIYRQEFNFMNLAGVKAS